MQPTDYPQTIIPPIKSVPLPDNTQDITNKGSHSPRALKAVSQEPFLSQDLFTRETVHPIFSQLYIRQIDLLSNILFNSDLELILRLRLVSKACWLASIKNIDTGCNALTDKAAISFQYSQLHPAIPPSIQEKYSFTTNNKTEIKVFITITDLLNPSSTLNSLSEDKLKLVLRIVSRTELNQIQHLFANQPGTKFINKIKELDFKLLEIKNTLSVPINLLFNTIAQNLKFFSSLTSLSIGNIEDIALNPSDSLNILTNLTIWSVKARYTFNLPDSFNDLKNFTIGCVENGATLTLPNSAKNLAKLSIGKIENNGTFTLPVALVNLRDFSIGSTWSSTATVNLPASLDNLMNLSVECVEDNTILNLPKADNVTNLSIKEVKNGATLNLSNSLKNLKDFTILTINGGCNLILPALTNFSILCIKKQLNLPDSSWTSIFTETKKKAVINFLDTLHGPKNLFIGEIDKVQLVLPDKFDSLETLTMGNLKCKYIKFPEVLDKLKSLIIGNIFCKYRDLFLPNSLDSLETLTIGNVDLNYRGIELPKVLDKLKSLIIGNISSAHAHVDDVPLTLPNSLNSLETLTIGNVTYRINIKLPDALDNLRTLIIGNISCRHFKLPDSLDSLETLAIGDIYFDGIIDRSGSFSPWACKMEFKLPRILNKLKSLTIGDLTTSQCNGVVILPDVLDNLTKLSLGNICEDSTIKWPRSLSNIIDLTLGGCHTNMKTVKQFSVQTVSYDPSQYQDKWYLSLMEGPQEQAKVKALNANNQRILQSINELINVVVSADHPAKAANPANSSEDCCLQ